MIQYLKRFIRLNFGHFLYAVGIVAVLKANIGYAPWEVFHAGLSMRLGVSYGMASIIVGVIVGILAVAMGEKLGVGMLINMVIIGVFVDIILYLGAFPDLPEKTSIAPPLNVAVLIAGLFIISTATYYYISSGFGAGPRDSLMVGITRKTGYPVGACRTAIELSALFAGWLLGGMVGVGTVISMLAIGFCIQITFRLFKFDSTKVEHETLDKTYAEIKALIKRKEKPDEAPDKKPDETRDKAAPDKKPDETRDKAAPDKAEADEALDN